MPDPKDFGESFLNFMQTMNAAAPRQEAFFPTLLTKHFKADAEHLPIVTYRFAGYEHPSVQRALDELASQERAAGRDMEVIGVTTDHKRYNIPDLASLISSGDGGMRAPRPGPVEYRTADLGDGGTIACVQCGLVLMRPNNTPIAAMFNGPNEFGRSAGVGVDVMAPTREDAERFLTMLRSRVHALSVYRGHALSIHQERFSPDLKLVFHKLPTISRNDIILPAAILDRIERQTVSFSRHAAALSDAGRHLKRGVLLHGPPGTGKTLTAMYLATQMTGRTVLLATGYGHGMLEHACAVARALQPATIVLEDVDLIAEDRETAQSCATPLLFELLNQMDGLAEDADILFVLTTNRPQALEVALSARPGRIDQAIEVPLPDDECRRRLIALYSRGVTLKLTNLDSVIARTKGASASFIKELLRRATLLACIEGRGSVIEDRDVDEALHELVISGGLLTRKILGFEESAAR